MRVTITGGAGFVGRSLARFLRAISFAGDVRLVDRTIDDATDYEFVRADLTQQTAIETIVADSDCVVHLAAVPGAAAARDFRASLEVNVLATLNLLERMRGRRLILVSSIAVYGSDWPNRVDEETPPKPDSTYGVHKRMAELAFFEAVRAGRVQGMCLRLPGIVARPPGATGFGSGFLSDVFHAARDGHPYRVPVEPSSTSWLMSSEVCSRNLLHAITSTASSADAITLPALRVRLGALVDQLSRYGDVSRVSFEEDKAVRRVFGSHPELDLACGARWGFESDRTLEDLVDSVFRELAATSQHQPSGGS